MRLQVSDFREGNYLARYMAPLRQAHTPSPIIPGAPRAVYTRYHPSSGLDYPYFGVSGPGLADIRSPRRSVRRHRRLRFLRQQPDAR
jgi:hypothetical protein